MGLIRILPDNVANQIAAGEVVERPASVVKELLENSLDAGATRIRIEVEAGGKKRILVVDDGAGMNRDDALLAFERHATSKLRATEDLLSIATLGFRGEALPSIAAVSRLQLETRVPGEASGTRIEIAAGKIRRVEEAGLPPGTSLSVNDLFYNTPARRKFLRAEATELAHISSLLTHYALVHPEKAFQLRGRTGDRINVSPATSLRERAFQLLGQETLDELVEFGPVERLLPLPPPPPVGPDAASADEEPSAAITLRGFLSRPQVQKLNRNSVFLFINRRVVRDRILLHAIQEAYRNLMPAHCFPVALLFLEMPSTEVDVNVHPSKTEVRFRRQSLVHDLVRDALRDTLTASRPVAVFPTQAAPPPSDGPPQATDSASPPAPGYQLRTPALPPQAQSFRFDQPRSSTPYAPTSPPSMTAGSTAASPSGSPSGTGAPQEVAGELANKLADALYSPLPATDSTSLTVNPELGDLRPLGQVRESFIVAGSGTGLWLIDQHAAHERVLFERFAYQRDHGAVESQRLLMPIILRLTPAQQAVWTEIQQELDAAGFESEPFGQNTFAIKAAPAGVRSGEIEKLINEIVETMEKELRGLSPSEVRHKIAASVACHAAIKINTPLEPRKMEWLLRELAATSFPMSCPHGRPIVLKYGMQEILKAFHRA